MSHMSKLFDQELEQIRKMNKAQLQVTVVNLVYSLKENHENSYNELKHAVEVGLTWN